MAESEKTRLIDGGRSSPLSPTDAGEPTTPKDLVNNLKTAQIITSPVVFTTMELVDRANHAPQRPYDGTPQAIGFGQTISAPHMHAHALELIVPAIRKSENPTLLDVGCGSGYLTAAMGRMVDSKESIDCGK